MNNYDPLRHFVSAYVKQAVVDLFWPSKEVDFKDYQSAQELVYSDDGKALLMDLGLPWQKIANTLGLEGTINERQRSTGA